MADLLAVPAQWVTLRAQTEEGLPVVVLVDQAVATTAPYGDHPAQVAVGVPYQADDTGLPTAEELPRLKQVEQHLVDSAAGQAHRTATHARCCQVRRPVWSTKTPSCTRAHSRRRTSRRSSCGRIPAATAWRREMTPS